MPTSTAPLETLVTIPLTERNAQSVIDLVVQESQSITLAGQGTGYVICAGGKYARYGYATCRWIREVLKDDAPIEVWVGNNERAEGWRIPNVFHHMADVPGSWPLKARAVRQSSFRYVVLLDADCIPLIPAHDTHIFSSMDTGALFFPDVANHRKSDWAYAALKIRAGSIPEMEAGQVIVDRVMHARAVFMVDYFNQHPEFFYHHHHGDKDLWAMAFARLKIPFTTGNPCVGEEWGLRHYLPDGEPYSAHLIHLKSGKKFDLKYEPYLMKYVGYLEEFNKL